MLGNRSESEFERTIRSELHRQGLRFRKHSRPVPSLNCKPDIVFTGQRVAVFIDGCFWHRCPIHRSDPRANASYWKPKLDANVARDHRNNLALVGAGWLVLRFWTHQPASEITRVIADAVESRTHRPSQQRPR
jgi:DNA mismatch endonuclease (patch repair protein)